jgi:UDP-N-acetylmuramoylalanine--D-glutamate ligase
VVAGNISPSLIAQWLSRYTQFIQNKQTLPDVWVLELSSFQLALNKHLCMHSACILNLSEDHLDWHNNMQDYLEAKLRIASKQTHLVLYAQDPYLKHLNTDTSLHSLKQANQLHCFLDVTDVNNSSTLNATDIVADWQINTPSQQNQAWLSYQSQVLIPMNALKIRGKHNALNALAALALCMAINVQKDLENHQALQALVSHLRSYNGEKHRVEWIAQQESLSIYDDSKGTNIGATLAAIQGLTEHNKRMAVILGGDAKGQQLESLMPTLTEHVHKVYLLGACKHDLASLCTRYGVDFAITADDTLDAFVQLCTQAYQESVQNKLSTLLLSPACASLDMFDNDAHRAKLFVQSIEACIQLNHFH